jgi:hypothetical protein
VLKVKQSKGKMFRGINTATMHRREVAAYRLDRDLFKLSVVPETLLINWKGKEASLQKYVEGFQPKEVVPDVFDRKLDGWKEKLGELAKLFDEQRLASVVLFDLVCNSADRHGKNLVMDTHNKLEWAIDNGATFGKYYGWYKNVFHKYFFYDALPVDPVLLSRLDGVTLPEVESVVRPLLSAEEASFIYWRIRFVVDHSDRLAFKRISHGKLGNNEFPSYKDWFDRKMVVTDPLLALKIPPRPGVVEERIDARTGLAR